mmetsp:Transcript_35403/g.97984  ORF Transcript_35403/g.97984 Transcript_35403/m.97984 type:complete len:235 (-) Transcript_35403:198-902(-)
MLGDRLHARRGPGLSEGVCKLDHVLAAREDGALEEKLESLADAHARHHEDRPRRADEGGDKLVQHHRADVVVVLLLLVIQLHVAARVKLSQDVIHARDVRPAAAAPLQPGHVGTLEEQVHLARVHQLGAHRPMLLLRRLHEAAILHEAEELLLRQLAHVGGGADRLQAHADEDPPDGAHLRPERLGEVAVEVGGVGRLLGVHVQLDEVAHVELQPLLGDGRVLLDLDLVRHRRR